jgi:hypothetical protein
MNFEPSIKSPKEAPKEAPKQAPKQAPKPAVESGPSSRTASPEEPFRRPRKPSDAIKPLPSPTIPVIRTQRPSPVVSEASATRTAPNSAGPDSPHGRNWAELATFMRTQREKGFTEIRVPKEPKNVHFRENDSIRTLSPTLPKPQYPSERGSRPNSPGGFRSNSPAGFRPSSPAGSRSNSPAGRVPPRRRFTDDEEWSRRPRRPSDRGQALDSDGRSYSPIPRKPVIPSASARPMSPGGKSTSGRKKYHEAPSPLTFGARGASIKPYVNTDEIPVARKDERSEKRKMGDETMRKNSDVNGVGLGIEGHSVRERVGML